MGNAKSGNKNKHMADSENAGKSNMFDELKKFNKSNMKPTQTRVTNSYATYATEKPAGASTALNEEEIKEFYDENVALQEKAAALANLMKDSKTVCYTGAGISTSAKIPDYRGPNGIWTLAAQGKTVPKLPLESALPTYTHMALKALVDAGLVTMVVSTNIDGLHRRSGLTKSNLAELHGNVYKEVCPTCGADYLRPSNVVDGARQRFTGRLCEKPGCGQALRDSIINFGENLPTREVGKAERYSMDADVGLVLGSSMRVLPACDLPSLCYARKDNPGSLAILNLQKTRFDVNCAVRIFGKCDEFMQMLMASLEIDVPQFDETEYIAEVQRQFETMIQDPNFDKLERYPGINKPCPPNVHAELINKVMKTEPIKPSE